MGCRYSYTKYAAVMHQHNCSGKCNAASGLALCSACDIKQPWKSSIYIIDALKANDGTRLVNFKMESWSIGDILWDLSFVQSSLRTLLQSIWSFMSQHSWLQVSKEESLHQQIVHQFFYLIKKVMNLFAVQTCCCCIHNLAKWQGRWLKILRQEDTHRSWS